MADKPTSPFAGLDKALLRSTKQFPPAPPLLRSFSAASAANKARSRHSDNRAAVTLSSRASSSRGSPRNSRLTARSFRFAEKRYGGGPPFSIIPSIRLSFLRSV